MMRKMGVGLFSGVMEKNMLENSRIVIFMVRANLPSLVTTSLKGNGSMANLQELGPILHQMEKIM